MPDREHLLGRTRQFISKVISGIPTPGAHLVIKNPPLLIGDPKTSIFKPTYRKEDILDVNEEARETETLVKMLKQYQDEIATGPKLALPPKDSHPFLTSEQQFVATRDYAAAIGEDYDRLIASGPFYYNYMIRHQILSATAEVIMHDNIARIIQLLDRYSPEGSPAARNYYSLQGALFAGEVGVRIGLTLPQFVSK